VGGRWGERERGTDFRVDIEGGDIMAKPVKRSRKGAARKRLGLTRDSVKDLRPEERQAKSVRGGAWGSSSRKMVGNDQPPD
jgi:hypothetical protein